MSNRIESHAIAGLLTGFVGLTLPFATISSAGRVTRFDLRVSDPPAGGSVVVELIDAGSGVQLVQGTIGAGVRHVSIPASVDIVGGITLGLRIVSESGGAVGLSGSAEIAETPPTDVTAFLTDLTRVKDSLAIAGLSADAVLTSQIAGVSRGMQRWMGIEVHQTVWTNEPHFPVGLSTGLVLYHGPIVSVEEVRQSGSVLAADQYRAERGRILRRDDAAIAQP